MGSSTKIGYTVETPAMEDQVPSYHSEFLRSPHHAGLALATLGLGFLSANLLGLLVGVTAYSLGWIYLPDFPFFHGWVDRGRDSVRHAAEMQKINEFIRRRDSLLSSLSSSRRERYSRLAAVCRDIETASADSPLASPEPSTDPRLRKLDELMWTYLRLLGIEESLEQFLETERREDLPGIVKEAEAEAQRLTSEVDALKAKSPGPPLEAKQRYLGSRLERLEVLRKRQQRVQQAQDNLNLVLAEQDRLDQQIKLIRADAVATKNAESLTARIDATVEHLDQTNKWLSELDEFKDLVPDMPATDVRIGYTAATPTTVAPPPVIQPGSRVRVVTRQQ
jgi:hypothetical protein